MELVIVPKNLLNGFLEKRRRLQNAVVMLTQIYNIKVDLGLIDKDSDVIDRIVENLNEAKKVQANLERYFVTLN